jgi:hypothetical protein
MGYGPLNFNESFLKMFSKLRNSQNFFYKILNSTVPYYALGAAAMHRNISDKLDIIPTKYQALALTLYIYKDREYIVYEKMCFPVLCFIIKGMTNWSLLCLADSWFEFHPGTGCQN